MLVLQSERLLVRVDPRHGGELLDLVDLATGRQLLGRPPFASAERLGGDLDEETWTERYRGGWQLVTPNAGNPCDVGGEHHGFHGRASNDPWEVVESDGAHAVLLWRGHGLEVTRRLSVDGDALVVEPTWRALESSVALVAVEHVSVGIELLQPEVELRLAGGKAYELSESTGPVHAPHGAPDWPEALLLDGSLERADRWLLERPHSRLLAVESLDDGRLEVANAATGQGLLLEWEADALPHLWIWHETRTTGGIWRGQTELLVVEPALVPHSLGLAAALESGQAVVLDGGETFGYRLTARPFVTGT
ncbi:MAG TPA: hypothetical protein VGF23_22875 [Gaiellaceae bacterium]